MSIKFLITISFYLSAFCLNASETKYHEYAFSNNEIYEFNSHPLADVLRNTAFSKAIKENHFERALALTAYLDSSYLSSEAKKLIELKKASLDMHLIDIDSVNENINTPTEKGKIAELKAKLKILETSIENKTILKTSIENKTKSCCSIQ